MRLIKPQNDFDKLVMFFYVTHYSDTQNKWRLINIFIYYIYNAHNFSFL